MQQIASTKAFMASSKPTVRAGRSSLVVSAVKVGDAAPAISLKDQSGRVVSLPAKKPTVLFFYPKDATPGCTRQAKAFRDSFAEIKKTGADVYGVSSDSVESHKDFAAALDLPFPLLSDEGSAARKAFGIKADFFGALPGRETVVIGRDGTVRLAFNNQMAPEKHAEMALEVLQAEAPAKKGLFSFLG